MIFETYAQRKRAESRAGEPEVYTYRELPWHLRQQISMIFSDAIGSFEVSDEYSYGAPNANEHWIEMDRICRKEIRSYFVSAGYENAKDTFLGYLERNAKIDIEDLLSVIEIGCVTLSIVSDEFGPQSRGAEQTGKDAIEEVNYRFVQHGVGYQFENRHIIRIDSTLAHAEIVKPALKILAATEFAKANEDFMTAHRHYRHGEYKDAVTSANRAFESMLKLICDAKGWQYEKGHRAAELVSLVTNKGLFTHEFDRSFSAYVAMMKSGIPAVRNDAGGHGEGLAAAAVTAEIARFAINMTATNILFLGESFEKTRAK